MELENKKEERKKEKRKNKRARKKKMIFLSAMLPLICFNLIV